MQELERSDFLFGFFTFVTVLLRLYLAPHTMFEGDVAAWRDDAYQMMVKKRFFNFYHSTIYAYPSVWSWFIVLTYILHPTLNYKDEVFLTLIKFPMILSDLVIGFLIYLLVGQRFDKTKGLLASIAWLFNPHVIYIGSMWGMNDNLCVVFIMAALYLLVKEKILPSAFMLGLALSTKQYAFFILPFLALAVWKKYGLKNGWIMLFIPVLVFGLISLPYLIYDDKYISQILYGVGEQQFEIRQKTGTFWYLIKSIYLGKVPSFLIKFQYLIFFILYAISLWIAHMTIHKIDGTVLNNVILIPTLVFLIYNPVIHAQYYVLFIPFAIIASFYKRFKILWYAITILPFHSFFSIGIWVDRAEAVLWQMIVWLDNMFSTSICDNLGLIRFALFFALSALLISSYIESGRE